MKIVFFGVPEAGTICFNALIQKQKNIIAVVPPNPAHPAHGLMTGQANQYNIPVLFFEKSPKEQNFIESFRTLEPDLAVVFSFDHLLPKEIIEIPPLGVINCHPSLLPDYRGGNPFSHVIINNEQKTGVTLHYMDESFDTGDIISQWETDIAHDETLGTLFNRLNHQGIQMMIEAIETLERGETLPRIPQIKTENNKYAPIIYPEKGHSLIDWTKDAAYIERFVRSLNPFFGAITYFRGCMIKIWSGVYLPEFNGSDYVPGSIINVSQDKISIATGKGLFFPTVLQIGNFLISDIRDFIKRTNPQAGETFLTTYN